MPPQKRNKKLNKKIFKNKPKKGRTPKVRFELETPSNSDDDDDIEIDDRTQGFDRAKFDLSEEDFSSDDNDIDDINGADDNEDDDDSEDEGLKKKTGKIKSKSKAVNEKKKDNKGEKRTREKHKFDFERNSRTVFVGNLPTDIDKDGVMKLFKSCGPVESARIRSIVPEKETLSPKVAIIAKKIHPKVNSFNAYVVFKTNEDDSSIKKALAMNGKEINGHRIRVDRASRPKAKKETLTSRKKSVFVGNLRFDVRDDELIKHFESKVGPVKYVRVVRDSGTGVGKGFGFVVFDERASVKKALEFDETPLRGRNMRIKKVEEDKKLTKNSKAPNATRKSILKKSKPKKKAT